MMKTLAIAAPLVLATSVSSATTEDNCTVRLSFDQTDDVRSILTSFGLSRSEFDLMNPKIRSDNIWRGDEVCVSTKEKKACLNSYTQLQTNAVSEIIRVLEIPPAEFYQMNPQYYVRSVVFEKQQVCISTEAAAKPCLRTYKRLEPITPINPVYVSSVIRRLGIPSKDFYRMNTHLMNKSGIGKDTEVCISTEIAEKPCVQSYQTQGEQEISDIIGKLNITAHDLYMMNPELLSFNKVPGDTKICVKTQTADKKAEKPCLYSYEAPSTSAKISEVSQKFGMTATEFYKMNPSFISYQDFKTGGQVCISDKIAPKKCLAAYRAPSDIDPATLWSKLGMSESEFYWLNPYVAHYGKVMIGQYICLSTEKKYECARTIKMKEDFTPEKLALQYFQTPALFYRVNPTLMHGDKFKVDTNVCTKQLKN